MEGSSAWGLLLIASTIVMHAAGICLLGFVLRDIHDWLEAQTRLGTSHLFATFGSVIGVTGVLLAVLHGLEAAVWAAAYVWLGALPTASQALLYSIDSMSTRGASGLMLENNWRLMGALEATDGMLLFGISTAFIFAVMQGYWPLLIRQHRVRRVGQPLDGGGS